MHTNRHTLFGVSDDCWYGDTLSDCCCRVWRAGGTYIRQRHAMRFDGLIKLWYVCIISSVHVCRDIDLILMTHYWVVYLNKNLEKQYWLFSGFGLFFLFALLSQKIQTRAFLMIWDCYFILEYQQKPISIWYHHTMADMISLLIL